MSTNTGSFDPSPDAIVIGAGSGGLTVAVGLAGFGKKVRLIERKDIGGDCTNVGCIPSKSLLYSTRRKRGRSPSEIFQHVRHRRDELRDEETETFSEMDGIDLQFGSARLTSPGTVEVTSESGEVETIKSKNIIVATGSAPRRLEIEGLDESYYLTNEELFELEDAPTGLAIIGAGPIGLEMATAFRRFGTKVVVLEAAPQVMPNALPEAAAVLSESLVEQEIDLRPGLVAKSYDADTQTLHIGPLDGAATSEITGIDKVLVAVGRVPNSGNLGLENLGAKLDKSGRIEVDGKGKTNVSGLWAVGDVTTEGGTTHIANAWGRRIVKAIALSALPSGSKPVNVGVTFSSPEVATIGTQPAKVPSHIRRLTYDFSKSDRSYTDEAEHGIIIVDVKRFSGKITGATIVGRRAGELISTFSLAMTAGVKLQKWYPTVWPYPTYADALKAIADQNYAEHLKNIHTDFLKWALGRLKGKA